MRRLAWTLPLLVLPPILQASTVSPSQSAPIIARASSPLIPDRILGAAEASSPAIRISPPTTVEVVPTGLICQSCNYNTHRCFFCGDDLTHAEAYNMTHPCYQEDDGCPND